MKPALLRTALFLFAFNLVGAGFVAAGHATEKTGTPRIDVILWFDTEDYLLPASDDSAKRLAELLSARGIHATFKVVGEKARTLERRGRTDVIAALKKHTIAFHSDFHSVHPTPSEYLADSGFLDGIAEFVRREGDGAADVRRIFGVKTLACYGQPGSSWASQAVAGLKQIGVAPSGVPCYVDEGSHVGLDQKPFWYDNAINVYHMGANYTRMELHNPAALEPAKQKVSEIAARLARDDGGGLISIFYHPCEWVHREFWDKVNFAGGRNPPREEWQAPPQRTPEETDSAFQRFGEYIDHIRSISGVHFITAGDLPAIYADKVRTSGASEQELNELAQRILSRAATGVDFQVIGAKSFSVADQFELLTLAVGNLIDDKKLKFPLVAGGLFGPDAAPPAEKTLSSLNWPAFRDAALDVREFIQVQHRVPARVFIGSEPIAPADFLVALASVYSHHASGQISHTETIPLGNNTTLLPASHIAQDTPQVFGSWVIHKPGFRAPKILEIARLQTWTLKPAMRNP